MNMRAGLAQRVPEEVRAYWEALRTGGRIPERSEFDPRGIERALPFTFILERVAPGIGRFRVAGMHLNDLMGMEVRGMPLTAFFTSDGRKIVADACEAMFSEPAIIEADLTSEPGLGRPTLHAKMMILPLRSDFGDMTRAVGCLVAEGSVFRVPRRFDVASHQVSAIPNLASPFPVLSQPVLQTEQPSAMAPRRSMALDDSFIDEAEALLARSRKAPVQSPEDRRAMFRVISPGK